MDGNLEAFAQRFGRHEQAAGEFVGLPFDPAVFRVGDGRDVVEPFLRGGVLKAGVDVAVQFLAGKVVVFGIHRPEWPSASLNR